MKKTMIPEGVELFEESPVTHHSTFALNGQVLNVLQETDEYDPGSVYLVEPGRITKLNIQDDASIDDADADEPEGEDASNN